MAKQLQGPPTSCDFRPAHEGRRKEEKTWKQSKGNGYFDQVGRT